jgi:prepilin-type N-terminal cleavage/methylation domain-containing protein
MRASRRHRSQHGFTLIEVIVSLALLVVLSLGVVTLFKVAIDAGRIAADRTIAVVLAAGKIEQLRSLEWRFELDPSGLPSPRTDLSTNASLEPMSAGGPGLAESPAGTLDQDTPPYVDYLDRHGRWVGNGSAPPGNAVYVRRWGIHRLLSDPARVVALAVLVTTVRAARSRTATSSPQWNGEDVLLTTLVTRGVR